MFALNSRVRLTLAFILCLLVGCQSAGPDPLDDACQAAGIVEQQTFTPASRGYDYRFHVYLPPCYDAAAARAYPLLILIPGRGGGPGDWFNAGAAASADAVILDRTLPPFIMVTTQNTDADPQATVILTELLPYIDEHYQTLRDRRYRAAAGGSLGGIAAYRLVLAHPDQFASAAQFGSGVIQGEEAQVTAWLAAIPAGQQPRVFLNTGTEDPYMLVQAQAMADLLAAAGIEATTLFTPGAHTYTYWATNLETYFAWLAEDW